MDKITKKILIIFLPALFLLAGALGLYQWQFNPDSIKNIPQNETSLNSFEDYYNTAQQLTPEEQTTEVDFFAVGDIMLSRNVAGKIVQNGKDSFWPFRALENELLSTDFNFGNLESPYSGKDNFSSTESLVFNAPTWTMPGLAQHNFKVLNLANNHVMDQGLNGLLYTKNLLTENYSIPVGAGKTLDEAWQGQVYSTKGVRIGFIGASYTSNNDGGGARNNYIARIEDTERLKKSITELKTRSDFVIVTMHAGTEYERQPNLAQKTFAKAAVDAGADLVIGAHPHWIQTIEKYNDKYIFYSLGNFIFDQMWSQDTREGLMLKISLAKDGACGIDPRLSPSQQQPVTCGDNLQGSNLSAKLKQIELVPVIIENFGQPRLATDTETKTILKKIGAATSIIK